ncbi:MAG: chemotaxis protein CheW [Microcoleaceae cyanobacterium]
MKIHPYLVFRIGYLIYGIEAAAVHEIFFLPEFTPILNAPKGIVGAINLRGELLPVFDFNAYFTTLNLNYTLTDTVIVIAHQNIQLGLLVSQVEYLENIAGTAITNTFLNPSFESPKKSELDYSNISFFKGITQIENRVITLVDVKALTQTRLNSQNPKGLQYSESDASAQINLRTLEFCPNATSEEKAIFHERANNLIKKNQEKDILGKAPIAVIGLHGEYFGVPLNLIREFTETKKVTPIPCTPSHIIGNMNLRGEIVTLVDLCGVLKLPLRSIKHLRRVMIIQVDNVVAGINVDDIFDIVYLDPAMVKAVPISVCSKETEYFQGAASYCDHVMTLLDLKKIIMGGELVVNAEV